jgi:hypothetical protein
VSRRRAKTYNLILYQRMRLSSSDFSPTRQVFFRRLLVLSSATTLPSVTFREFQNRGFMSLYWIWVSYIELDRWHIILSVIFVALHLDKPNEWPRLFPSSPMQAYGLRRFWGIFWHRLATPSCVLTGRCVGRRVLRILPGSRIEKVFVAFWSFLLTGVFHAIAECYSSSLAGWHPRKSKGKHNVFSVELHCQYSGVDICAVLSSICKES